MHAVFLAGGCATGFGGSMENPYAKSLVKVGGHSILEVSLKSLVAEGFKEATIVIPNQKEQEFTDEAFKIEKKLGIDIFLAPVNPATEQNVCVNFINAAKRLSSENIISINGNKYKTPENALFLLADQPILAIHNVDFKYYFQNADSLPALLRGIDYRQYVLDYPKFTDSEFYTRYDMILGICANLDNMKENLLMYKFSEPGINVVLANINNGRGLIKLEGWLEEYKDHKWFGVESSSKSIELG